MKPLTARLFLFCLISAARMSAASPEPRIAMAARDGDRVAAIGLIGKGTEDVNAKLPDGGKLNFPKIFRRQGTFWAEVPGPLTRAEFVKLLNKGLKGKPDTAYPLAYFLSNINNLDPKKRVSLASKIGLQGQTQFKPEDLVFREDPTTLLDASGNPVTKW